MTTNDCMQYARSIQAAEQALAADWPSHEDEERYLDPLSMLVAGVKFRRWASLYEPGSAQPSKQQRTHAKQLVIRLQRRYDMFIAIAIEFGSGLSAEQANEAALNATLLKTELRHARHRYRDVISRNTKVTQAEIIAVAMPYSHEACH